MAWLKIETGLVNNPKIYNLAAKSGVSPNHVIGCLVKLWLWCLDYAWNGDIEKARSGIEGICGLKVEHLVESGFLDDNPLRVHDWFDYTIDFFRSKYKNVPPKLKEINRFAKKRTNRSMNRSTTGHTSIYLNSVSNLSVSSSGRGVGKPKTFTKPAPQEVADYAKSIGFELDGQKFCDYYESKGWVIGKSPMKDWKACVRTWKSNGHGGSSGRVKQDGYATAKPGKYPD